MYVPMFYYGDIAIMFSIDDADDDDVAKFRGTRMSTELPTRKFLTRRTLLIKTQRSTHTSIPWRI